jgi:hypothetical protein
MTTHTLKVTRLVAAGGLFLALFPRFVSAQAPHPGGPQAAPTTADLPQPVAPATIVRANGQVVVRAIHLTAPLVIDGKLDEGAYSDNLPADGFIQAVPANGKPVSERTEAWVMYDDTYLYISAKLYDSVPPEKWIANELRRDTSQLRQNDMFGVLLDTYHDRRNGYNFYTNPLGGFTDQLVTDEGNPNADWNPVWDVRSGRFDGGWTTEMAIPFKSLRYVAGENQIWGIQLRRSIRRKNEWAHLTALPAANGGPNSIFRISQAATLVGLNLPGQSANVQVKPYVSADNTSDRVRRPPVSNDIGTGWGGDLKYGITANLTADVTVRTDFAQVEVDEQQLNLTRFQLQFPEKREFFLEGRGTFDFGRNSTGGGGSGVSLGFGSGGNSNPSVAAPQLFYSRRIGLTSGSVIPIDVGGRLTGKTGRTTIGALNLQTADHEISNTPSTNFTVLRVRRDLLRRSVVGAMLTNRSESVLVPGESNLAYGVDGTFSFFNDLTMSGYFAQSNIEGRMSDNRSYTGRFDYAPDRYGFRADFLKVGANYNPEVGFANRTNFSRSFASARFSPRPIGSKRVRKYTWEGTFEYVENGDGFLETRNVAGRFLTELQNSDLIAVVATDRYENLARPFTVSPGHTIPKGVYSFGDLTATYGFGQQRRLSGSLSLQTGGFYDGDLTALTYSTGRFAILKQWSLEPSFTVNWIDLPTGAFTSQVYRARTDYGFSPRRFISALVQYSSADNLFSSNLRYRWEYRPGSELFVVYTDERDTTTPGYPGLRNRAFVVKLTRLFQF